MSQSPAPVETSAPATPREPRGKREGGLTFRVVALSLFLAGVFGVIIPHNDYRFANTVLGSAQLPVGALSVLLFLLVSNLMLRVLAPGLSRRLAWSRNETLVVYIACLFACLTPGRASSNLFINVVVGPFYYATPENGWGRFLQPYLKPWLTPALDAQGRLNPEVVNNWYLGSGAVPWQAWAVPLGAWGALILALYVMFACLASMLRAQWAGNEVLAFPLLRLPLEMTEGMDADDDSRFALPTLFRNPLLWVGTGVAVFVQTLNGLNFYFPDVPAVALSLDFRPLLSEAPWNQIGRMETRVMPIVIGIAYLLSAEISLSIWFFYLLHKGEYLLAYYAGYLPSTLPDPVWTRGYSESFISYQSIGAFFAFAGVLVWTGRRHYAHILSRALGRTRATEAEAREALSHPLAFWGFVLSSAFLLGWTMMAGVDPLLSLVMWGTYGVIILGLTRVVVEAGLVSVNHGWSPLMPFANLVGGGAGTLIAPASAIPAALIQTALMVDLKGLLLPCFLQSFKLAHDRRIALRPLLTLIFAVTLIATTLGILTTVSLGYAYGGLQLNSWFSRDATMEFANSANALNRGIAPDTLTNGFWFGIGGATILTLIKLRAHFSWFPLHPIGYLMWAPYSIAITWFSFFLGWGIKTQITRFGGHDTYRRATPIFLGLILGDVLMMLFWLVIDTGQGRMNHNLMAG